LSTNNQSAKAAYTLYFIGITISILTVMKQLAHRKIRLDNLAISVFLGLLSISLLFAGLYYICVKGSVQNFIQNGGTLSMTSGLFLFIFGAVCWDFLKKIAITDQHEHEFAALWKALRGGTDLSKKVSKNIVVSDDLTNDCGSDIVGIYEGASIALNPNLSPLNAVESEFSSTDLLSTNDNQVDEDPNQFGCCPYFGKKN
jgi:hypothetical protein